MAQAQEVEYRHEGQCFDWTPPTAQTGGTMIQWDDGRAAYVPSDIAANVKGALQVMGVVRLAKTASIAILRGCQVFWDHSANKAHFKPVNDRDFYVGVCVGDSSESDTEVDVALNVVPNYRIDMLRDGYLSVPTGTAAAGGFGYPVNLGKAIQMELTATNEAQCIDALSVDRVSVSSNPIAEFVIRPVTNGSTSAVDINFGLANGTSTTDADAIAESAFFHIDGGSTAINAESDDGTTEVAATDTTKTISAGSAVANRTTFWIDARDPAGVKMYVDGVRVLSASTFVLTAATGPLGLLAHIEKTSGTATAKYVVDVARLWTCEN